MRTALLIILLAACGGGKKKEPVTPTEPVAETTPAETTPAETTPAEPAKPPEPPAPSPEELAKQAATEQVASGKTLFAEKGCNTCHGDDGKGKAKNPALVGPKALPEKPAKTQKVRKGVAFKTAADVMGFIKAKMPLKKPGTLSDDEAAALTAWIMTENGKTVEKKLDAEAAAAITIK